MTELKLPERFKGVISGFTRNLKNIYGKGLISVILYGSAASGEFSGKLSNINLLIILDDTSLDSLNKISKILFKGKFKIINPLFFTEDYIRSSADVFPIEFLDIKENYLVLSGKDILAGLEVDLKNLRFQCEQELKAKLINIKSIYLRSAGKVILRNALFKSFISLAHILRNLIRLKGRKPPYLKEEVLAEASREFNIDASNFYKILTAREGSLKLTYKEIDSLFRAFTADLEKIISIVDKI